MSKKRQRGEAESPREERHVQALLFRGGNVATIFHVPHGVWQGHVCPFLSDGDVNALSQVCRFLREDAVRVLGDRSEKRFGKRDPLACLLAEHFAAMNEAEMNKGEARSVFRLTEGDLETLDCRVEEHWRWSESLFSVEQLMKRCLERHGTVAGLMAADKLRKQSEVRPQKVARRKQLVVSMRERGVDLKRVTSLSEKVRKAVDGYVRNEKLSVEDLCTLVDEIRERIAILDAAAAPFLLEDIIAYGEEGFDVRRSLNKQIVVKSAVREILSYKQDRLDAQEAGEDWREKKRQEQE